MISIFKERLRVPEIRDNDSASAVLVHGLVDHDERIRREIAAAAGLVQLRRVAEIVNSSVGPFEQKESVAILLLAMRKHPALQRGNVAPIRCAELQALIGKKSAVGGERFLIVRRSLHRFQSRFQIAPNLPLVRPIVSGEPHRFESHQPCRQRLLADCREPPQARTCGVRRHPNVAEVSFHRLGSRHESIGPVA